MRGGLFEIKKKMFCDEEKGSGRTQAQAGK